MKLVKNTLAAAVLGSAITFGLATTSLAQTQQQGTARVETASSHLMQDGRFVNLQSADSSMTVRATDSDAATVYRYSETTEVVDQNGNRIEMSRIEADTPVKVEYIESGDVREIQRVTVKEHKERN